MFATIDIGTNSVLLLIGDTLPDGRIRIAADEARISRLGEGLTVQENLSSVAIDRTLEYLQMREAFGKPLLANQYIQYQIAELVAEIDILHGFLHHTAERYVAGEDVTRAATVA